MSNHSDFHGHSKVVRSKEDIDLTLQKKFSKEVIEICQPIHNSFNVTYFCHSRAFHDGKFATLLTHPEVKEYLLIKKDPIQFSDSPLPKTHNLLLTTFEREKILKDMVLKKVKIPGRLGDAWISQREFECLQYADKNLSLKEIAKYMKLSP